MGKIDSQYLDGGKLSADVVAFLDLYLNLNNAQTAVQAICDKKKWPAVAKLIKGLGLPTRTALVLGTADTITVNGQIFQITRYGQELVVKPKDQEPLPEKQKSSTASTVSNDTLAGLQQRIAMLEKGRATDKLIINALQEKLGESGQKIATLEIDLAALTGALKRTLDSQTEIMATLHNITTRLDGHDAGFATAKGAYTDLQNDVKTLGAAVDKLARQKDHAIQAGITPHQAPVAPVPVAPAPVAPVPVAPVPVAPVPVAPVPVAPVPVAPVPVAPVPVAPVPVAPAPVAPVPVAPVPVAPVPVAPVPVAPVPVAPVPVAPVPVAPVPVAPVPVAPVPVAPVPVAPVPVAPPAVAAITPVPTPVNTEQAAAQKLFTTLGDIVTTKKYSALAIPSAPTMFTLKQFLKNSSFSLIGQPREDVPNGVGTYTYHRASDGLIIQYDKIMDGGVKDIRFILQVIGAQPHKAVPHFNRDHIYHCDARISTKRQDAQPLHDLVVTSYTILQAQQSLLPVLSEHIIKNHGAFLRRPIAISGDLKIKLLPSADLENNIFLPVDTHGLLAAEVTKSPPPAAAPAPAAPLAFTKNNFPALDEALVQWLSTQKVLTAEQFKTLLANPDFNPSRDPITNGAELASRSADEYPDILGISDADAEEIHAAIQQAFGDQEDFTPAPPAPASAPPPAPPAPAPKPSVARAQSFDDAFFKDLDSDLIERLKATEVLTPVQLQKILEDGDLNNPKYLLKSIEDLLQIAAGEFAETLGIGNEAAQIIYDRLQKTPKPKTDTPPPAEEPEQPIIQPTAAAHATVAVSGFEDPAFTVFEPQLLAWWAKNTLLKPVHLQRLLADEELKLGEKQKITVGDILAITSQEFSTVTETSLHDTGLWYLQLKEDLGGGALPQVSTGAGARVIIKGNGHHPTLVTPEMMAEIAAKKKADMAAFLAQVKDIAQPAIARTDGLHSGLDNIVTKKDLEDRMAQLGFTLAARPVVHKHGWVYVRDDGLIALFHSDPNGNITKTSSQQYMMPFFAAQTVALSGHAIKVNAAALCREVTLNKAGHVLNRKTLQTWLFSMGDKKDWPANFNNLLGEHGGVLLSKPMPVHIINGIEVAIDISQCPYRAGLRVVTGTSHHTAKW
jgi:uncharacterized coiled-coil protein SlyX